MWWEVYLSPPEPRPPGPSFTLDDFVRPLDQVRRLGAVDALSGTVLGVSRMVQRTSTGGADVEKQMNRMRGIYNSMTGTERRNVELLDRRRRHRIARGAGVRISEVRQFLQQFRRTRHMVEAVGGDR